jgi:glyceraldehyde 3-phosphate dehydrogenase
VADDLIQVIDGNMIKIMAWYDNEWGYSNRLIEMALFISKK